MALWSYYLGVFSVIPCFGLPLGIGAVICGWQGLQSFRSHPEIRGKTHSYVGLGLGLASVVVHLALIIIVALNSHIT